MCYKFASNLLLSRVKEEDDVFTMKNPALKWGGFSLLEMLVVVAVVAIMMALMLPAIAGFSSTAGRRGAVNILMNTFEQARIAAIEGGRPVHVLLYRRNFPEPDAVMVVRDPADGLTSSPLERLTKWTKLPKGVLLHDPGAANILNPNPNDTNSLSSFLSRLSPSPQPSSGEKINLVTFNETGGVDYPSGSSPNDRKLYLSEGTRGDGGSEQAISTRKNGQGSGGGFEVLSLSRYTGRVQLDITTTTGN